MVLLSGLLNPFTFEALIGLIVLIALLFVSAMVSGSETAFFSLNPLQLKKLGENENVNNELVLKLYGMPKRLLATILITNNFVNVSIVILSTFLVNQLFNLAEYPVISFIIQAIIITALILAFGEIMPKILATQRSIMFCHLMAKPLKGLISVLHPISTILIKSTSIIDKRVASKGHQLSRSELSEAIEITTDEEQGVKERQILQGIVRFGDIDVKEIMKSRTDVTAVDLQIKFDELLAVIRDSGYSRLPVYKESFDNVTGLLYVKDLLPHLNESPEFKWQSLTRSAFFIPENKKINDLLKEFQEKKVHLAIVVDEYGGTSGIVTMEDVIEEIIGDISDEFDLEEDELSYTKIDDKTYIFEGKTTLIDFCRAIDEDENIFDNVRGDADSLAGLVLELTGEMPIVNTKIRYSRFCFVTTDVDNRRIKQIKVIID